VLVRLFACLLLTWAAADLFVPELCSAESSLASTSDPAGAGDHDDCFCCCSHALAPLVLAVRRSEAPFVAEPRTTSDLAAGVYRSLYHPPLDA
jgi:hypothetical protein